MTRIRTRPRSLLLILLLAGQCLLCAGPVCAVDRILVVAGGTGVSAESIGCKEGADPVFEEGVNNSTIINGYLDSDARLPLVFKGGTYEIPETIVFDARWGHAMFGAGALSRDLGDDHYTGPSGLCTQMVTRFVWTGATGGTMMRFNGGGDHVAGFHLQGMPVLGPGPEPTGGDYTGRAEIGLHFNTYQGGSQTGAASVLGPMSFYQIDTDILIGNNLDDVGELTYEGDGDDQADQVVNYGGIWDYHPFSGSKSGVGSVIHIRNNLSYGDDFPYVSSHGNPEQVVYVERGIKSTFGSIDSIGDGVIALRVGLLDINSGNLNVGRISIDGTTSKVVKSDVQATGHISRNHITIGSWDIRATNTAVPQFDLGPYNWRLSNGSYLRPGSIKLTGKTYNDSATSVSRVDLDGCSTAGCTYLSEVLSGSSAGPRLMTWRNCDRYTDGGSPPHFGDVYLDSTPATEIISGRTRATAVAP